MKYAWLALLPVSVMAQEPIEIIEVTGEGETLVLPSEEPVEGVFGLSDALQEIPRAATMISRSLMDQAAINDLHDIARFAPNSFAAAGFGNPSLPSMRGQLGELFEAGMRRQAGNNGLGVPMSFNSIEGIAVVKGAPPVMLGTTQRVGGFVNLLPKKALTDKERSRIRGEWGQWSQYRLQLDHNEVLKRDKHGLRVSAEFVDHDSFYDYTSTRSDDVFVAYRFTPNSRTEWDIGLEYYDVEWTDNAGINRPTQALIDDNLYITGQGVQPNGSTVPGAYAIVSPTGQVEIDRSRVLTDPADINNAKTTLVHSTFQQQWSDALIFVNRTYYQYLEREGINQNSFVDIIDGAHTFENRAELHINDHTIVGINLRVNDVLGYSQFSTEADLPTDLTGPISNRRIPLTAAQQAQLVELRPGLFVSPGTNYDNDGDGVGDYILSDTTDSLSQQWGLFAQHELALTERWQVTAGARLDYYDVTAKDPLPPVGFEAAEDSYNDWLSAISLSSQYQLSTAVMVYASAYESDSTSNSMAGGTVLNANQVIDSQNFATENTLYEIGIKIAPVNSRWYTDVVVFDQTRSLRNRDGSNSGIATQGVEAQWNYRSENGFWATLAASYLDAHYDNSAAFQDTRQVADLFDNSRPDIINGTGVGAPNFAAFPASNQRLQGVPEVQASAVAGWQLTPQWSVGGDLSYTQSYPLDYLQTVMIRDQYMLNLNATYQITAQLSARLDVFNATDEENWSPVFEGGYFGSTLAFPSLPRHAQLTVDYRF